MRLWIGILVLCLVPSVATGQAVLLGEGRELDPFAEPPPISKLRDRVIAFASARLEQKEHTFEVIERQVIRVDREGEPAQWIQVTPLLNAARQTRYSAEHKQTVRRAIDRWLGGWERQRDGLWKTPFADLQPGLRIQAGDATLTVGDDPIVCRPFNPHQYACLYLQLPSGDEHVRESLVRHWDQDRDALLDLAIAQTTNSAKLTRVDRGNGMHVFEGRSWKNEASLFGLGPLLSEDARCGVVLAARRNGFVVHRQEGTYDLMGPGRMVEEVVGRNVWYLRTYEAAFQWLRGGVWTPYPITVNDRQITLHVPPALRECLGSGAE